MYTSKANIDKEGNEAADEAAKQGPESKDKKFQTIKTPAVTKTEIDDAATIRQEWKRKWQKMHPTTNTPSTSTVVLIKI